jgi:hypothetical protein
VNTDIVQAPERGDTTALAAHLQPAFPHDPRAATAPAFAVAVLSSPDAVAPIGREPPFLNSAAELLQRHNVLPPTMRLQHVHDRDAPIWRERGESSDRNPIRIDEDLDFFGDLYEQLRRRHA